ncbi:MAG: hypothetical protein GVY26_00185 [Bacteroidetes bacterium]|jgi:hypothetical protein|nr:hypothetical protein [Bacteroidota bacterium]
MADGYKKGYYPDHQEPDFYESVACWFRRKLAFLLSALLQYKNKPIDRTDLQTKTIMLNHTRKQSRSSSLTQATLLNSLVTTDSTYDTNERFVNELYLSTIAQGYLPDDELDIEQLWSIATQCPLQGGDAVFRARSIYRLFNPLIYFPDDSLCQSDSLELRQPLKPESQPPALTYHLFPNPSQGQAPQLVFSNTLSQSAEIQVLRINGSTVSNLPVRSGVRQTIITNTVLQPGVYLSIVTLSDGERLPVERFVIVE